MQALVSMVAATAALVAAVSGTLGGGAGAGLAGVAQAGGGPEGQALGRVLDREGVAAVRSAHARAGRGTRWRALEPGLLLEPGDRVEVATRGANAARLRLADGAELVLGPGTLVELPEAGRVALHRGELACEPREGGTLTVVDATPAAATGSGVGALELDARAVLRAGPAGVERLAQDPRWLAGYESDQVTEAVGALLANVDGRDVPLTIGYHKVTVDIRDQLARTVIEQSFVNHTGSTLEGVFYFPLPADASISGFGMWIGGELVQGDIVEKQRAREIYETILREKRDPGLLEWTGGNLFKARVFPIGAEKRIRISYTQVLPREGDGYRYRYALDSELLRVHPLGRLELEVELHSERPLAAVSSPSHGGTAQLDADPAAGAQAHSARYEFSAEQFTPDGDFELRVALEPAERGLTLVPHRRGDDGYFMLLIDAPEALADPEAPDEPLDLLVLADTSGSMWGPQRASQVAFVEALLQALDEQDRFDLATCDVETRWAFGRASEPTRERREAALDFLEAREPLGWSDLELTFTEAFARAGEDTRVVYVGDAVPTAGAADPVALARALEAAWPGRGSFHVVVPGSSSEPLLARAIAGLGGGSLRTIGAGSDPLETAHALLEELTAPALEGLALDFRGLPVAAVYPERLPALPAGAQQVVVGRFDASRGDLDGTVVMTASVDGRALRSELPVTIPAGEEGNSFVPRLWARRHLDHLLEQGSAPEVIERIERLSADYQIVTPYTSLLVLESEADRERFGVPKSFRMRDGEEFFLEGREAARHDLARAAMQASAGWRRRLRLEALGRLEGMGRELTALLGPGGPIDLAGLAGLGYLGGVAGARVEAAGSDDFFLGRGLERLDALAPGDAVADGLADSEGLELEMRQELDELGYTAGEPMEEDLAVASELVAGRAMKAVSGPSSPGAWGQSPGFPFGGPGRSPWERIFPGLPEPEPAPEPAWPDEVRALLEGLDRRADLAAGGWRVLTRSWSAAESSAAPGDAPPAGAVVAEQELVTAPGGWWTAGPRRGAHAHPVQWLDGGRRGLFQEGWRLGRERAALPGDALDFQLPLRWLLDRTARQMGAYRARLETDVPGEPGRARATLWMPAAPGQQLVLELDLERGVVLEERWLEDGELRQSWTAVDLRQVGGRWWPGRVEHRMKSTDRVFVTAVTVEELGAEAAAARLASERSARVDALLLGPPLQPFEAKRVVAEAEAGRGEDDFQARMTLLERALAVQDRGELERHLEGLDRLVGERPGFARIHLFVLEQGRRREGLRLRELELARELAAAPRPGELGMALDLMAAADRFGAHEALELLRALLAVVERAEAADSGGARSTWDHAFLGALGRAGRGAEYLVAARLAAERHPDDPQFQSLYAGALAAAGRLDDALAWLDAVLAEALAGDRELNVYARRNLRRRLLDLLWNGYRPDELVRRFEGWDQSEPAAGDDHLLDAEACGRYLAALVVQDRVDQAFERVDAWAALAAAAERAPVEEERLRAATDFLMARTRYLSGGALDLRQRARLAELARDLSAHEDASPLLGTVLGDWRYRQTDEARSVLKELHARLERRLEGLPAEHVLALVGVLYRWNDELAPEEAWHALAERLFARWRGSDDEAERQFLGQALVRLAPPPLRREYLRAALAAAARPAERYDAARQLWSELVSGEWDPAAQAELFGLLALLDGAAGDDRQRDALAPLLVGLVDWSLEQRARVELEAAPDRDTLTRRELATLRREARARAGAELSRTLGEQAAEHPVVWLRDWIALERLWLDFTDARAAEGDGRRALELAAARADELLASAASEPAGLDLARPEPLRERVLSTRALTTAALAVTRRASGPADEPGALERDLRALLGRLEPAGPVLPDARGLERDLLTALDRTEALDGMLAEWFGDGSDYATLRFGIDRAVLLAERGELEAAASLLERVRRFDQVPPDQLLLLADWYTALDRREDASGARLAAFEARGEQELARGLQTELGRYQRSGSGVPEELASDVPARFVALMRKATDPGNHLWTLRSYYQATKDFRLLECLPQAVIGHSAQGIYGFLEGLSSLTETIDEEAVVDRVVAQLDALEAGELTAVDRRALALVRFQVVHLAARQTHGTERHVERSLAALRSALPPDPRLVEGEAPLMAQFLMRRGRVEPGVLAEELLRQLRALAAAAGDPDDRLTTAQHLATALWNHDRRDEAVRALETALDARREAAGGALPRSGHSALEQLSGWLVELGSFPRAEALWADEAARAGTESLRLALERGRLGVVHTHFTASRRPDAGLYARARDELLAALEPRTDEDHARELVRMLCEVWDATYRAPGLEDAADDARDFAFGGLPDVLRRYQHRDSQNSVQRMTSTLERLLGPTTALEFLVVRAETEPAWLELANRDFWAAHGWQLAQLRPRSGEVRDRPDGDLARRLLALVRAELRRDLTLQEQRSRGAYDERYSEYWRAHRDDFLATAMEVATRLGDAPRALVHAAGYLFEGLSARGEALGVLGAAHGRGALDLAGRRTYADYLQRDGRWAASLPVLADLNAELPGDAGLWAMRLRAHHELEQAAELERALAAAEAALRAEDAWREDTVRSLAAATLDCGRFEDAVRLIDVAIAMRRRAGAPGAGGDAQLSQDYRTKARALSALGRTREAVDAASGAILAWGRMRHQRREALDVLEQVLVEAEDLEGFVQQFEREVEETGLENPIVRKGLAAALAKRGDQTGAAAQLERALAQQPSDLEAHQALTNAYRALGRDDLLAGSLLERARAGGHDLALYRELGEFLERRDPATAERAFTNLVELSPEESEGHAALAEVRERQRDPQAALTQWDQVVRIRTGEPQGYLGRARALIALGRTDEARGVLEQVRGRSWPEHFGDVRSQADRLLRELSRGG